MEIIILLILSVLGFELFGSKSSVIDDATLESLEKEINEDEKWAQLRQRIFEKDDFECTKCGFAKNLVVHKIDRNAGIEVKNLKIYKTLCFWCHLELHGEKPSDCSKIGLWEEEHINDFENKHRRHNDVRDHNYFKNDKKKEWTFDFNGSEEKDSPWSNLRNRVFKRDGYKCVKCGFTKNLTVDHITPKHAGGLDELSNLRTLCALCHEEVHNRKIFGEDEVFSNNKKTYNLSSKVQMINSTISSGGSISISYTDKKGKTTFREIEPFKIFEEHGRLYVRANCKLRNEERTFRISRIKI
jgi:5-methylcytosine-specific restriction endonuclease McrA